MKKTIKKDKEKYHKPNAKEIEKMVKRLKSIASGHPGVVIMFESKIIDKDEKGYGVDSSATALSQGKITSGGKRLTSNQRLVTGDDGGHYQDYVVESPELDGTYGHSGDYVYFWTTDGVYVQWNGEYMLSDQPLKLSTQPELIRTIK